MSNQVLGIAGVFGLTFFLVGAVLFTLLVKGLTIEPLVRRLSLDRPLLVDRLARLESDFAAKHRAVDRLPELLSGGLFNWLCRDAGVVSV